MPGYLTRGRVACGVGVLALLSSVSAASPTLLHRGRTPQGGGAEVLGTQLTRRAPRGPLAHRRLYVDPHSSALLAARRLEQHRPHDAALIRRIARTPTAMWLGDWFSTIAVQRHVARVTTRATRIGRVPVFVLYAIPQRDCGGYSSGGLTADRYLRWVDAVGQGIGTRRTVVIVEPDALAGMDCLSAADQRTRLTTLHSALHSLAKLRRTTVYLDAGHSGWQPASVMATRLREAGVGLARGFALNISNFDPIATEQAYGDTLGTLLGGKHYVIDTSRNGRGPAPTWCNPPGQALGVHPSASTSGRYSDAYLWIKRPGESDGTCNGGPPAGEWWTSYALGLVRRALH
jgi:endoglucanase